MSLSRSTRQYLGVRAILPPDLQTAARDPTSSDKSYVPGTLWLNKTSQSAFMWPGSGNWIPLGGSSFGVSSITATGPLTANGVSGSSQTGAVTLALTTPVTGTYGGTGVNNGTRTITLTGGSNGYVLTSDSSGNATWVTPPNGTVPYSDRSTSFSAAAGNGYFCTAALTATLPLSATDGQSITIACDTSGTVVIQASGSQIIRLGSTASSAGGTATSTAIGSSMELVYRAASSTWFSISTEGSFALA